MYVLHGAPDSASTILRLVLTELGLPHDCRMIDRAAGDHDSPAYRAMQPMGLVPALETPDGPMFETAAMLIHLADRHPGLAPQAGDTARADWLGWFIFTNNSIHTTLLQVFYPDRVAGPDVAAAVMAGANARLLDQLALLEAKAATRPVWLSPDAPSSLGYYIAVLLRWLAQSPPDEPRHINSAAYPALHAVLTALETRPAARAVARAEELGDTIFTNPAF